MHYLEHRNFVDYVNEHGWSGKDFVSWLRSGLQSLRENDNDPIAKHFAPLWCDNTREQTSQVMQCLRESARLDPTIGERLRGGLNSFLRKFDLKDEEAFLDACLLWGFYGELGEKKLRIFMDANSVIERLAFNRPDADEKKDRKLVGAIGMVMARVDIEDELSIKFFEDLHDVGNPFMGHGKFWDPLFFQFVMDKSLKRSDAVTRLAAWEKLKTDFPDDVEKSFDPKTSVGRSMINSCIRQLCGVNMHDPCGKIAAWPQDPESRLAILKRPNGAAVLVIGS